MLILANHLLLAVYIYLYCEDLLPTKISDHEPWTFSQVFPWRLFLPWLCGDNRCVHHLCLHYNSKRVYFPSINVLGFNAMFTEQCIIMHLIRGGDLQPLLKIEDVAFTPL